MKNKIVITGIFLLSFFGLLLCFNNNGYPMVLDGEKETGQDVIVKGESARAVNSENGVVTVVKTGKETADYKPGEIIIKLKQKVAPAALYKQPYSARISNDASILAGLKKKYKLKDERPVFNALHSRMKLKNRSLKQIYVSGSKAKSADLFPIYILKTDENPQALSDKLKKDPNLEYAEPNYGMEVQMVPNDPYYSTSGGWGQTYSDLWGLKPDKLNCEAAWDISQGEGVVVAVIDTGVDYNHPDLWDNIWVNPDVVMDRNADGKTDLNDCDLNGNHFIDPNEIVDNMFGWDFANDDNNPMDGYGHGTHVAGTIAATGNNNIGVIGVAPKAKIMILKGLSDEGSGYIDRLVQCVTYAADHGAHITNNSWGGQGKSQLLEDAFRDANDRAGALSIAAAGNSSADAMNFTPANIPCVMTVSAFDHYDRKCSFSNYGIKIDVAAPGGGISNEMGGGRNDIYNILSPSSNVSRFPTDLKVSEIPVVLPTGETILYPFYRLAGTSMACPHAAGAAALVKARHPEFTNNEIRQVVRASADDVGTPGWDAYSGNGRINCLEALQIDSISVALISSPANNQTVSDIVDIYGTASGDEFDHYILEYAEDTGTGMTWTTFATGTTQKINEELGEFDPLSLQRGNAGCFIKLTVIDNNAHMFSDLVYVKVKTLAISNIPRAEIYRSGTVLDIVGTVSARNLSHYTIEYRERQSTNTWLTTGITLENGGTQPVTDGLLGRWDTSGIEEWPYAIKLTAHRTDGAINYMIKEYVIISPLVKENFPIRIDFNVPADSMMRPWVDYSFYMVDDLDGDSLEEIILCVSGNPGRIFVFKPDGSTYPGWPIEIPVKGTENSIVWFIEPPLCADLDLDGKKEILIRYEDLEVLGIGLGYIIGREAVAYNHDGTDMAGWNVDIPLPPRHAKNISLNTWTAIADLDRDGIPEVIFPASNAKLFGDALYITDNFGGLKARINSGILQGPAFNMYCRPILSIGNMDDDPDLEVVFYGHWEFENNILTHQYIYAVNMDGAPVRGWPADLANTGYLTLADLDRDGNDEVLVPRVYPYAGLHVLDANGGTLQGWPQLTDFIFNSQAVAADWDNNGDLEIFVEPLGGDGYAHIFEHDGQPYAAVPRISGISVATSPILTDFNNDNTPDILGSGRAAYAMMRCIDGSRDYGWLLPMTPQYAPRILNPDSDPIVRDIDNDGYLEIINVGKFDYYNNPPEEIYISNHIDLIVWDVPYNKNPDKMDWTMARHDSRNTGRHHNNHPPVLNSVGNRIIGDGVPHTINLTASDPDSGDIIFFFADNLPQGALLDQSTGVFTWTPSHDQLGVHNVIFGISDGDIVDREYVAIVVDNPPVLATILNRGCNENSLLQFTISATDPDNDSLTYSASNLPQGATFDPQTRTFTWRPTYEQAGVYENIHFEVTDGYLSDSQDIRITVFNVNRPPVLSPIGNKVVQIETPLEFTISATDPDNEPLTYHAGNLPPSASFNPDTRVFSWSPTQVGTYRNVHFSVYDGHAADSEEITIVVVKPNHPPVLDPIGNKEIREGQLLQFRVSAKDPDGDKLYFGADNLPPGAKFDYQRRFTWKPTYNQAGKYRVTFWVTDINPGSGDYNNHKDSETITITVADVPPPK